MLVIDQNEAYTIQNLSSGGKFIAIGSPTGTVQVIQAISLALVFIHSGHTGPVSALAWSPDGRWLASGGEDGMVHVWNATTGDPVSIVQSRRREANTDVCIDAMSGKSPSPLQGHGAPVSLLAWSPDSRLLASASGHEVKRWNIRNVHLLDLDPHV